MIEKGVNSVFLTRTSGRRQALILWLLLFFLPILCWAEDHDGVVEGIQIANPGADLWRDVRQRLMQPAAAPPPTPGMDLWGEINQQNPLTAPPAGTSRVVGVDSGQLINPYGDQWRRFRMERLLPYSSYLLGGMLLFVLLFYMVRGRVPIVNGVSGNKLFRYSVYERTIHWFTASIFLLLATTGLVLLYGRSLLLPWMGPEGFAVLASACKEAHNLFGPLFAVAIVLMFLRFVGRNIYQKGDLTWLLRGGGVIGTKHVPSNFFNMGEKTMFWMLILVGGGIVATGLILVLPLFGQGRVVMELAHVAHTIGAVAMVAVVIGHIYIGTIGMEGALEGMKTGYCDLNWAREHHDWWAERCVERGEVLSEQELVAIQVQEFKGRGMADPELGREER